MQTISSKLQGKYRTFCEFLFVFEEYTKGSGLLKFFSECLDFNFFFIKILVPTEIKCGKRGRKPKLFRKEFCLPIITDFETGYQLGRFIPNTVGQ